MVLYEQIQSAAEISESRYGVGYQALLSFLEDIALLTNQEEENRDADPTGGQVRLGLSEQNKTVAKTFTIGCDD